MPNIFKPRKKTIRFEDSDKYKSKSTRVYYIMEDDVNVYIDNTTNYGINNPISILTSYQSTINNSIYGTAWKESCRNICLERGRVTCSTSVRLSLRSRSN